MKAYLRFSTIVILVYLNTVTAKRGGDSSGGGSSGGGGSESGSGGGSGGTAENPPQGSIHGRTRIMVLTTRATPTGNATPRLVDVNS